MGSQPGGGHETPVVDWVAVGIMLASTIALGLALPLKSWWLAIGGLVVGLIGVGIAVGYGIMNHTEDYTVHPRPEGTADRPPAPRAHRITSA